jgi:DNA-binding MarR family transcriptional regulator
VLPSEPTDCPYYLVSRATLVVTAALRRELAAADVETVRPAYLGVLMCLWREDGLKVVELGRRAGLEPSTMTGLLDRMERDGLVARTADPHDRRALRILLTERGRAVQAPVTEVVDRTLATMFAGMSEAEVGDLKHSLRRVLANAQEQSAP